MESSVRYVQLPNAGQKPALCFRGTSTAFAVVNTNGVRTMEISLQDHDKSRVVQRLGQDYMPRAFAEAIKAIIQRGGLQITQRAQYLLDSGTAVSDDQVMKIPEEKMPTIKEESEDGADEYRDSEVPERPLARKVKKLPRKVNGEAKGEGSDYARLSDAIMRPKAANGSVGTPRPADRPPKPTPIAPLPNRAAATVRKDVQAKTKRAGGKTLVATLAAEAGLAQQPCRVKLRAAGLRAPYDEKNEVACRKALGLPVKGKK